MLLELLWKDFADFPRGLGWWEVGKGCRGKLPLGAGSRGSRVEIVTVAVIHAIGLIVERIYKPGTGAISLFEALLAGPHVLATNV